MSASTKKKTTPETAPATAPVTAPAAEAQTPPAPVQAPALVAYYAMPVPKGTQPVLSPIGAALAHDDGEGFTLQLHLMPPVGAHILLRKPVIKKTA